MLNLDNKTVLITGGTGSFGRGFAEYLLKNFNPKKLIIFSRDELKQFKMQQKINDSRMRYFIGDVRDLPRLQRAFDGVDVVIHAAALKQVPMLEYNPFEAVKTNILGSQNVIEASIDRGVERVVLISTDKAAQPVNLYGSTKLCAEKLFISGNTYTKGTGETKFSCVRYGNVIGSRGSIIETLLNGGEINKVSITDDRMTRFWITMEQAYNLVLFALENMVGGEIFIPKVPSQKLVDLFDALAPEAEKEVVGIRPGEKLHETLLTREEAMHAVELEKYYVVIPEQGYIFEKEKFKKYAEIGNRPEEDFVFTSDTNREWLSKEDLLCIVKELNLTS